MYLGCVLLVCVCLCVGGCLQMGSPARREQASYPPGQLCYELHWDTETSSSGETPCGSTQV